MKSIIVVKKWLAAAKAKDLSADSRGYNAEFTELTTIEGEPEQMGFIGEIVRETEKALCLKTEITDITGHDREWNIWFPKSQIIANLECKIKK